MVSSALIYAGFEIIVSIWAFFPSLNIRIMKEDANFGQVKNKFRKILS